MLIIEQTHICINGYCQGIYNVIMMLVLFIVAFYWEMLQLLVLCGTLEMLICWSICVLMVNDNSSCMDSSDTFDLQYCA